MSFPSLISISGAAGSGKDTVAKMIQQRLFNTDPLLPFYEIKRFAGKLKEIASILLNVPASQFENRKFKESVLPDFDMTTRVFLQKLGTEALRNGLHKDIWVNSLFREFTPSSRWIIPDCRFRNEAEVVWSRDGICIEVDRPDLAEDPSHNSETEWRSLPFDCVIDNSGDLIHLKTEVQKCINWFS